jgi:dolichol-phosphate mannosyltransferase
MPSVSIVVPCFNEASGIPYLSARLRPALETLRRTAQVDVIFVDDGSRDETLRVLHETFGAHEDVVIARHEVNRGLAAAMRTGFSLATGDVVCTIDSDCSYDPLLLPRLVAPIASGDADVVTASPYHPEGAVVNVPAWRVALSRMASGMYRHVLPLSLYTYTSCCRACRRSALPQLAFEDPRFAGVSEMLVSAILAQLRVVEIPARLEARRFGVSKMRTVKVIRAHLRLLTRLVLARATGRAPREKAYGAR